MSTHVSPVPSEKRNHAPAPPTGSPVVPVDVVRQLMAAANQNSVRHLLVRTLDVEIEIEVEPQTQPASTPPRESPPGDGPAREAGLVEVLAPAVGVVRLIRGDTGSAEPTVGAVVGPDDQVAQIEAMKMTTPVRAGHAGIIREVCVRDGDVVEFRQPLLRLEPAGEVSDDAS
ncbi:hypothetical protein BS329_01675 [Amycolatopsis coloradensis]|uniref:Lipoyl-binding domain-containing protein n=1 Tax=Amycolatopsis coloradensis TaxID=76021 RepID=A0A1R0L429_9PSEU|nr:acetyl-CoA carboxylase biotin carboxyl carrier protein subunit [Amycolatopsis coloradensis]OLZ57406.1 hypothetical protein BS329_01675 [Amycolatopsis coloradensis]